MYFKSLQPSLSFLYRHGSSATCTMRIALWRTPLTFSLFSYNEAFAEGMVHPASSAVASAVGLQKCGQSSDDLRFPICANVAC